MTDINAWCGSGRLVKDAELKYSKTGTAVCSFSIASNWSRKFGDEWKEEVSYFDCVMFAKRAEALHKYLTKGQEVLIKAEARQDRWEQDGNKRSKVVFHIDDIKLVGGKRSDSGSQSSGSRPPRNTDNGDNPFERGEKENSDFDDDVPF